MDKNLYGLYVWSVVYVMDYVNYLWLYDVSCYILWLKCYIYCGILYLDYIVVEMLYILKYMQEIKKMQKQTENLEPPFAVQKHTTKACRTAKAVAHGNTAVHGDGSGAHGNECLHGKRYNAHGKEDGARQSPLPSELAKTHGNVAIAE